MMIRTFSILVACLAFFFAPAHADEPEEKSVSVTSLTVVELFTAQGCPKCPPAIEQFHDIAATPDVLALSWSVDAWDFMEWKDSFADPSFTARQKAYNKAMDRMGIYTPQMVVNGTYQMVGNKPEKVAAGIDMMRKQGLPGPNISVTRDGNDFVVTIADAEGLPNANVLLVWFDEKREVDVRGGKNAGKVLRYANVVMGQEAKAEWSGEPVTIRVSDQWFRDVKCDSAAILLQQPNGGPILSAARIDWTK